MNKTYERNDFLKIKKIIVIVLSVIIALIVSIRLIVHFYSVNQREKLNNDYTIEKFEVVNIYEDESRTSQGFEKNYKIVVKYYDEDLQKYQNEELEEYYTYNEATQYLNDGYIDLKFYNNENLGLYLSLFLLDNYQFGFFDYFVIFLFIILLIFIVIICNDLKIRKVIEKGETIIAEYHDARYSRSENGQDYKILYTYLDSNGHKVIGKTHDYYTSYELDYFRHNKNLEIKKYKNISVIVRSKDPRYQNQTKIPEITYCDYCGTHIEQGRKKCKYCGSSIIKK